jgi:hypothetical protein
MCLDYRTAGYGHRSGLPFSEFCVADGALSWGIGRILKRGVGSGVEVWLALCDVARDVRAVSVRAVKEMFLGVLR